MRNYTFLCVLAVFGCSSSDGPASVPDDETRVVHLPRIAFLELTPGEVQYMQGAGSVTMTAEIRASDVGEDIATLVIEMSNGDIVSIDVSGLVTGQTGTITGQFDMATTEVGRLDLNVWLVDAAGDAGPRVRTEVLVNGDVSTWIERAAGLPNTLNDVTDWWHDFFGFVAVGDAGTIMTSDDGLTWTEQDSGTTVDLNAVSCTLLTGCFTAGDEGTILQSWDGEDWNLFYDGPDDVSLTAFLENPFAGFMLAAGHSITTGNAYAQYVAISGPWTPVELPGPVGQRITDLGMVLSDTLDFQFVATVDVPSPNQGRVLVSADGVTWVEVFISDGHDSTYSIAGHGDELWAGGTSGHVYSSPDGINWTKYETPALTSNLVAMVSRGDFLVAHGFSETIGAAAQPGVVTSDGGQTWQMFETGDGFEARGLAYSNGRWVSVGQLLSDPGKGVIYTTE